MSPSEKIDCGACVGTGLAGPTDGECTVCEGRGYFSPVNNIPGPVRLARLRLEAQANDDNEIGRRDAVEMLSAVVTEYESLFELSRAERQRHVQRDETVAPAADALIDAAARETAILIRERYRVLHAEDCETMTCVHCNRQHDLCDCQFDETRNITFCSKWPGSAKCSCGLDDLLASLVSAETQNDQSRSDQSGNIERLTNAAETETVSDRETRFAYLCAGCGPIDVIAPDGTCPYCGASSEDIARRILPSPPETP